MYRLFVICCALLCVGCHSQHSDFFPYYDDGTPKPYVTCLPVMNDCSQKLPWNVPEELTKDLRTYLMQQGRLFLPPMAQTQKAFALSDEKELASSKDLMPFLNFQPSHFVVLLQLIEYKQVPYERGKIKPLYIANLAPDQAMVLMIKLRLKVVDIRGNEPKIIRQEIFESNHVIAKNAMAESKRLFGTPHFGASPIGMVNARLVRDLAVKIEGITCSQKR